ncbi:hypothetical protein JYT84_00165 [bacterium AH-315-M10]|nr:hypothetical protein [bacterium AH-315-M10]
MKAHIVREWFEIRILRQLRGAEVVGQGLASEKTRASELARDRDLIYFELEVTYRGGQLHRVLCGEFTLQDSEGFMVDSASPHDALDVTLEKGQQGLGGVMFGIYGDLQPAGLWLDTGHKFDHGSDAILLEVVVDKDSARRPVTWQEEAALGLERQLQQEVAGDAVLPPLFETESLMGAVSRSLGMPYKKLSRGFMFRVELAGGRTQFVMMNFSGRDEEGSDLIKFLTLCAPVGSGAHNEALLKANPKLSYGGIGIVRIDDEDLYVLTNTQLVDTADLEELTKSVSYLAAKGDELEAMLTGGQDLR